MKGFEIFNNCSFIKILNRLRVTLTIMDEICAIKLRFQMKLRFEDLISKVLSKFQKICFNNDVV